MARRGQGHIEPARELTLSPRGGESGPSGVQAKPDRRLRTSFQPLRRLTSGGGGGPRRRHTAHASAPAARLRTASSSVSESYRTSFGSAAVSSATDATHATPPVQIADRVPVQPAIAPART